MLLAAAAAKGEPPGITLPGVAPGETALPRLLSLDAPAQVALGRDRWRGAAAFSAAVFGGWEAVAGGKDIVLRYVVRDGTPRTATGYGEAAVERTDHCELWLCDGTGEQPMQWGMSRGPDRTAGVEGDAHQWMPPRWWRKGQAVPYRAPRVLYTWTPTADGYEVAARVHGVSMAKAVRICFAVLDVADVADRAQDCMLTSSDAYRWKRCETFNALIWGEPGPGSAAGSDEADEAQVATTVPTSVSPPSFIMSRREYRLRGRSEFATVRNDGRGRMAPDKGSGIGGGAEAVTFGDGIASPTGHWQIARWEYSDEPFSTAHPECREGAFPLVVTNSTSGNSATYARCLQGFGANPVGWHPTRDLFYYEEIVGPSNSREVILYQYDPASNRHISIGDVAGGFHASPDGRWILGQTAENNLQPLGQHDVDTNTIWLYDIESSTKYVVAAGVAVNRFLGWR